MDLLNTAWKLLLLRGVMGVLFGILAIAWPISTVIGLAVLWGIWALADGIGLFGVVLMVLALVVRTRAHDLREGPSPTPA